MSFISPISSRITRGRRRTSPSTMIAPACSGGMRRKRSAAAWPERIVAGSMDCDIRALLAMLVATPPGWTVVTPTPEPSSSLRSASEKPRTPNLEAQ